MSSNYVVGSHGSIIILMLHKDPPQTPVLSLLINIQKDACDSERA